MPAGTCCLSTELSRHSELRGSRLAAVLGGAPSLWGTSLEDSVHAPAYVWVLICMCLQTPEKDEYSRTRQQMTAHIDVCMGGRVAEELIFGAEQVRILRAC